MNKRSPFPLFGLILGWAGCLLICPSSPLAIADAPAFGDTVIESSRPLPGSTSSEEPVSDQKSGKTTDLTGGKFRQPASREVIAELIEGLGSDSYATRVRCRDRLAQIGLAAFDQLRAVRKHPDSEIAIVARALTSGLQVRWAAPTDPASVRELLTEYGSRSVSKRRAKIEALARMPRRDSFAALVRLARFETNASLSRLAALELMGQESKSTSERGTWSAPKSDAILARATPKDLQRMEAEKIETTLAGDDRISSRWLRQYAQDLRTSTFRFADWSNLVQSGRRKIGLPAEDEEDVAVTADELLKLILVSAERGRRLHNQNEALELIIDHVDLIPSRTRDLIQFATWALEKEFGPAVIAMYQRHHKVFEKSPILLYSAAEAHDRGGNETTANGLAKQALAINPLPEREAIDPDGPSEDIPGRKRKADNRMHPLIVEQHAEAHVDIAVELKNRGLFRWAQQEYQLVIDRFEVNTIMSAFARLRLADMLGELQRHAEVVHVLQPLADRIDRDDAFKRQLVARRFSYLSVRSDLDFHQGLLLIKQGRSEAAQPVLQKAFETNSENIDILIAMYRLDGDAGWRDQVTRTLVRYIRLAENEVIAAQDSIGKIGPFATTDTTMANKLNAYAWLVSNTEGDFDTALRYSQQSLRLTPGEPALMDTCARCHYAAGNLDEAIAMQERAVELMPHSPPLQRQLQEFKKHAGERKNDNQSFQGTGGQPAVPSVPGLQPD